MSRKLVWMVIPALVLGIALAATSFGQGTLTRDNWVKEVGFGPNLSGAPEAGLTLTSSDIEKWKKWIPEGVQVLMKKYGFKIWTKKYEQIVPADTYIAATNKFRGTAKTIDTGGDPRKTGLEGYAAGLPFPQPKNGVEVAWNYTYSYGGDDSENFFAVYWISAKGGIERSEDWTWTYINRAVNRTDIDPRPAITEAQNEGVQYYSLTTALTPPDKKGFSALYTRMIAPQDQQGFIYVPAQRKSTRFAFGTRGDAWNNTDLLYEDVRGYMGYPEWMNWTVREKTTMLLPMNSQVPHGKDAVKQVYDFETAPHWNFKAMWEPRPTIVLDVTAKFKDYPYSKMVFYMDAETYYIAVKDAYDKKGQLWKVLVNAWNASTSPKTAPQAIGTSCVIDLQSEHATAFGWHKSRANVGLKPEQFTLTQLRKIGK